MQKSRLYMSNSQIIKLTVCADTNNFEERNRSESYYGNNIGNIYWKYHNYGPVSCLKTAAKYFGGRGDWFIRKFTLSL